MTKTITREQWLTSLAVAMTPHFTDLGLELPAKIRVSCGWPSSGALARKSGSRTIGQCFPPSCSVDETVELFISPVLDAPMRVADVLAHELIHAALPNAHHSPTFKRAADKVGLGGKPTATVSTPAFEKWVKPLLKKLGKYPHSKLDVNAGHKKQSTRLIKMECGDCGYVARTTRKWLDSAGTTICPCGNGPMEEE